MKKEYIVAVIVRNGAVLMSCSVRTHALFLPMCVLAPGTEDHINAIEQYFNQVLQIQIKVTRSEGKWTKVDQAETRKEQTTIWHVYRAEITAEGKVPLQLRWIPVALVGSLQEQMARASRFILVSLRDRRALK